MNDPGTWTLVWGWTLGTGGRLDGGGQRRKNWDNCNRINKNKKIKILKRKGKKHRNPEALFKTLPLFHCMSLSKSPKVSEMVVLSCLKRLGPLPLVVHHIDGTELGQIAMTSEMMLPFMVFQRDSCICLLYYRDRI